MTHKRGGLGKGLGALIPTREERSKPAEDVAGERSAIATAVRSEEHRRIERHEPSSDGVDLAPVPGAEFREIPVGQISPNPKQPRAVFEEGAMEELKASIEIVGVLQPIVVRRAGPQSYELIMGERRFRACQSLGRTTIPAIIKETGDDVLLRDALLENIHRADLNPLEEAAAYQQLLAEFGVTHEELAHRIGRSRPQISNTVRLLNLPSPVQRRVAAGVLSAGHARALLALEQAQAQDELAHRIVAEGLSVRATEEIVAMRDQTEAPQQSQQRRSKPYAPGLTHLAERLADQLETRVKVDMGRKKGKIVIEFATVDDLNRIVASIDGSKASVS
ncbi:MAG: ParB/RepB/Spo0J family partition protein [Mycobacteriales bacterium]